MANRLELKFTLVIPFILIFSVPIVYLSKWRGSVVAGDTTMEEPYIVAFSCSNNVTFGILGNISMEENDTDHHQQLVLAYTIEQQHHQSHHLQSSISSSANSWYAKVLHISGLELGETELAARRRRNALIAISATFVRPHLVVAGDAKLRPKALQDPQFLGIYDNASSNLLVNEYVPITCNSTDGSLPQVGSLTFRVLSTSFAAAVAFPASSESSSASSSSPVYIKPDSSHILVLIQIVPRSHLMLIHPTA